MAASCAQSSTDLPQWVMPTVARNHPTLRSWERERTSKESKGAFLRHSRENRTNEPQAREERSKEMDAFTPYRCLVLSSAKAGLDQVHEQPY